MEVTVANKMKGSVLHTLMHMCISLSINSIIVDRRRVGGRLRMQQISCQIQIQWSDAVSSVDSLIPVSETCA